LWSRRLCGQLAVVLTLPLAPCCLLLLLLLLLLQARYKFARVKQPLPIAAMTARGMPLPGDDVEVLEDGLAWEDIVVRALRAAVG
jgi:hypothetical protein